MPGPSEQRGAREVVVGLLWHSVNSDNMGVGALTLSQIAIIDEVARSVGVAAKFHILGWVDRREHYVTGPNVMAVPLTTRRFLALRDGFLSAVRRCDFVCDIGGGDSFTDIYGPRRFVFLAGSKFLVLLAGRPLVLSPQTIGPFERSWTRRIARLLMNRARAVVARDEPSRRVLDEMGVRGRLITATDVAFRLPYDKPEPRSGGKLRVGLNVSGLLYNGGYDRKNMFGLTVDYPELVRTLIRHFTARPECELHLVSHVITDDMEVEDDYRVAVALAKEFPAAIVAPRFSSPIEAKSFIAGLDYFSGSRMHACIAAFSAGVPVVPMAYSRKFSGLFGSLGYTAVADCKSETTEAVAQKVMSGFVDRARLKEAAAAGNAEALRRLAAYEDVLREYLTGAAARR